MVLSGVIGLAVVLCAAGVPAGAGGPALAPPVTLETLLSEATDLQRLMRPAPDYVTGQASSYDRASVAPGAPGWFANTDHGNFVRVEQNGGRTEYVMLDVEGPGAVTRIWTASSNGTLRVYVDGAPEPVIEEPIAFLLAGMVPPYEPPLVDFTAEGRSWYVPIPYATGCKMTIDAPAMFYYQVNYRTYPAGTQVESFSPSVVAAAGQALEHAAATLENPQSLVPSPQQNWLHAGQLRPGEDPATILAREGAGGGLVRELRLQPSRLDPETLRGTLVTIRFDGQTTVQVPLGDLFGTGPGLNPYQSLPMSAGADGVLLSRWVMPFQSDMEIQIDGSDPGLTVLYRAVVEPWSWQPGTRLFHARWHPDHQVIAHGPRDWSLIEVQGAGRLVGTVLNVTNPFPVWWGEGDEKIWVDGDPFPGHFGTGTEDYFGYAWGSLELFDHPYHGQTRMDDDPSHRGRTSLYRWHVMDPIPFEQMLRFDLEQLSIANPDRRVLYDATSYWYAEPGAVPSPPPPAFGELVVPPVADLADKDVPGLAGEGEALPAAASAGTLADTAMYAFEYGGRLWSEHRQLHWQGAAAGETLSVTFDVPRRGRWRIEAYLTRRESSGAVRVTVGGQPAVELDLWHPGADPAPTEAVELGSFWLDAGPAEVGFESLGASPADPSPPAVLVLGVDCLAAHPDSPPGGPDPRPRPPADAIGTPPGPVQLQQVTTSRASS